MKRSTSIPNFAQEQATDRSLEVRSVGSVAEGRTLRDKFKQLNYLNQEQSGISDLFIQDTQQHKSNRKLIPSSSASMSQSLLPQNTQPFIYYAPADSIMEANIIKASQTQIGGNQKHASIQMHKRYFANQLAKKRGSGCIKKNTKKQRKYRKKQIEEGLILLTIITRRLKRQSYKKIIEHSKNVKSHQQQLDLIIKLSVNGFRRVLNSKLCRIFFDMMQKLRSNAELVDRIKQQTAVQLIKQEQSNEEDNQEDQQVQKIMKQNFKQDQRSYAQMPNKMRLSKILSPVFNKKASDYYQDEAKSSFHNVKTMQKVPSFLSSVPPHQVSQYQQNHHQFDSSSFFSPNQSELLFQNYSKNNLQSNDQARLKQNQMIRKGIKQAKKQRFVNGLAKIKYVLSKKLTKWNLHLWIRLRENCQSNFTNAKSQKVLYQMQQPQNHQLNYYMQEQDQQYFYTNNNPQYKKGPKSTATLPPQIFEKRNQQLQRYIEQRRQVVFRQNQQRSQFGYRNSNYMIDTSNNLIADCSTQMNSPELASPSRRGYSSNQRNIRENFQFYVEKLPNDAQFKQKQQQQQQQYIKVNQQRGKNYSQAQNFNNKFKNKYRLPRKQFQSQAEYEDDYNQYYNDATQQFVGQRQSTQQDQTQFSASQYKNQFNIRVPFAVEDDLSSIMHKSRTQSHCTNTTANLPQFFHPSNSNPGEYDQEAYRQLFADEIKQGGMVMIKSPLNSNKPLIYNFNPRSQIMQQEQQYEQTQQQYKDQDDENIQMIEQHQSRVEKDIHHISQYVTEGRELFDEIKDIVSYNQMIADKYKNILDIKEEQIKSNKSLTSSQNKEEFSPAVKNRSCGQFSDISGMQVSQRNVEDTEQFDDEDEDVEQEKTNAIDDQNNKVNIKNDEIIEKQIVKIQKK